jgi:GntR family transcriptional regulator/MocR family aminotransferase
MLRPWELSIDIVRESGIAIHVQIAKKIIADIQSGRFTAGTALPGTRILANRINVNRKTVIQAYDELIAQGWLISESKRGTFISSRMLAINHGNIPAPNNQQNLIYPLLKDVTSIQNKRQAHHVIDFTADLPDTRLIPFEMLSRAMRHALITSARNNKLIYGDPKGTLILRQAILQMLNIERGLHANIENICIVRGSQMGIFLAAKVFIESGDYVALEELSNPLARDAFKSCGAHILHVAHDDEGIDVVNLELLCIQYKIRAVYVTPHHQIPTTVTMSLTRRKQLLALAEQYNFFIIEDDSGHEFNFTEEVALPIASEQTSNHVIYVGSLSQILAPSFRIGYIVAPKETINRCTNYVNLIDRQGDMVSELAIAELLHTGEIKRHHLRTLKIYQERRALISQLILNELSEFVSCKKANSGLSLWLDINPSINVEALIQNAIAERISITPVSDFSAENQKVQAIRLGFAHLNEYEIRTGIQRLKDVLLIQRPKLLQA